MSSFSGIPELLDKIEKRPVSTTSAPDETLSLGLEDLKPAEPQTTTTPQGDQKPAEKKPIIVYGSEEIILPVADATKPFIVKVSRGSDYDYDVYFWHPVTGFSKGYIDEVVTLLNNAPAGSKLNFFIRSPGGSVDFASAIIASMKTTKAEITTIACGCVASAATALWIHGHKQVMRPGSYFMIHMSTHGDYGNSKGIADHALTLKDYVTNAFLRPMLERNYITQKEFDDAVERQKDIYVSEETWRRRISQTDVPENEPSNPEPDDNPFLAEGDA